MDKNVVKEGASLILNGDFSIPELASWQKGMPPHDKADVSTPIYQGQHITVAHLRSDATLAQTFDLAAPRGKDVRYVLRFDFHARLEDGYYEVGHDNEWDPPRLLPASGSLQEEPLDFEPSPREQTIALADETRQLTVRYGLPQTANLAAFLDVTWVSLRVHLPDLVLRGWTVDQEVHSAGDTLYLCRGAEKRDGHAVRLQPANTAWIGSLASMEVESSAYPLIDMLPKSGVQQELDRPWVFIIASEIVPTTFTLNIQSKWDATPYALSVSVDDHRVRADTVDTPAYDPIVNQQSVQWGMVVVSHYTKLPVADRKVVLEMEGVTQEAFTDTAGKVHCDYLPKSSGMQRIKARIESLYYAVGFYEETQQVRVLAADPWLTTTVTFQTGTPALWGDKTGYPHRGGEFTVTVNTPADSPLRDYSLNLVWEGPSAEQLKVNVSPPLNEPVRLVDGKAVWTLDCTQALEGDFQLRLSASRLLSPSPPNTMSLAYNLYEIAEWREADRSPIIDEQESLTVMLRLRALPSSRLAEGVEGVEVTWQTPDGEQKTLTGKDGWTELVYRPSQPGAASLVASIVIRGGGEPLEQAFFFNALASNPWKEHVQLTVTPSDQRLPEPLGFLCWREGTVTLSLTPRAGSPLIDKPVKLNWRDDVPETGLSVDRPLGVPELLPATGLSWTFTAADIQGGRFVLKLTAVGGTISHVWEIAGRVVSRDLAEEGSVRLDNRVLTAGVKAFPCLGAEHSLKFIPNPLGPLTDLLMQLDWEGTSAEQLNIRPHPLPGNDVPITAGGVAWNLDCTKSVQNGEFQLQLRVPVLNLVSALLPHSIGDNLLNIAARREASIHPVVADSESALLQVQIVSAHTLKSVQGVAVSWKGSDDSNAVVVPTRPDGWSRYAYQPATAAPADHTVTFSLVSPYNDEVQEGEMTVHALATSPWLEMIFQHQLEAGAAIGERTYFPRRGTNDAYKVSPRLPHLLEGVLVRMGWTGTAASTLQVKTTPPMGGARLMTREGLGWDLILGNARNGSFGLFASAATLLKPSPVNPMTLGDVLPGAEGE